MQSQRKLSQSLALWAALTALFTNLAAINLLTLFLADDARTQAIAAAITAIFTAGGVYARQRWDDSKTEQAKRQQK